MLVALDSQGIRTLASLAKKDSKYVCPFCHEMVVLKQGIIKIHHFAHNPGSVCENAGESDEHLQAKLMVQGFCQCAGWTAEIEAVGNGWRADVLASYESIRIAFEIQLSKISESDFYTRSSKYALNNITDYWIFSLPINWDDIRFFLYQIIDPVCCYFTRLDAYKYWACDAANGVFFKEFDERLLKDELSCLWILFSYWEINKLPHPDPHCPNRGRGIVRIKSELFPYLLISQGIAVPSISKEMFLRVSEQFPCLKGRRRKTKLCEIGTLVRGI